MVQARAHTFPGKVKVDSYIHKIYGYRYNWHDDMYEIDIVLRGELEFYRGGEKHILRRDDMIVVDPGVGHASYPICPNTETLVLRFSARALKDFTPEDQMRKFSFASDEDSRNSQTCRMIRYFAAQIVRALWDGCVRADEQNIARSSLGMIAYLLSTQLPSEVVPWSAGEEVDPASSLMADITGFITENYAEKLMLQDVADQFHYNRTYISLLFKQTMGIGFHEYLTRVRFSKAIYELGDPKKNLSQVALDNGFSSLKAFNQLFLDNFRVTPKEYRSRLIRELSGPGLIPNPEKTQTFLDPEEPEVRRRLEEYLTL